MLTAFVFPGQGPQEPAMLEGMEHRPEYALVCELLGEDVKTRVAREPSYLNQNEVASLVTVLCSKLELSRMQEAPTAVAGYSVGQWTAMHAAGMLSFDETLRIVFERAKLMNASDAVKDGAMLAVIGLPTEKVEAICASIDGVAISNYNCLGQLTLAGTRAGIEKAQLALEAEKPRKLARVDVSGAWHCWLLAGAADQLGALLAKIAFAEPKIPVADNVTGTWLPRGREELLQTLTRHLDSPVRWDACVRTLVADKYLEVGHGEMLTKFGFFIDRKKQHVPSKRVT